MLKITSFAALFMGTLACATSVLAGEAPSKLIPASDRHLVYDGRFDTHDPKHVVVIWQSSNISTDFKSQHLNLEFGASVGQDFFDADVDGVRELVALKTDQAHQVYVWPHPLDGSVAHHLTLSKRNESNSGYVTFEGLAIDQKGKVSTPAAHHHRLNTIFFGDSITAGACNEDGANDQWDDRRTHNANKSYAAFTAEALDADWQNISVSGMGIDVGYVPFVASQIWDRVYPKIDSPRADLSGWTPDLVFVNYGENDTSFTKREGKPFPTTFTADYVSFVQQLRTAYPKAEIVLLRGGMGGGAEDPNLRAAWTAAVEQLEKQDKRVAHFVFKHFTAQHPRVVDDEAMADELAPWLKQQAFVKVTGWH